MSEASSHRHDGIHALTRDVAALPSATTTDESPRVGAEHPGQGVTATLTDALLGSARRALLTADQILYGTPATGPEAEFLEAFGRHLAESLADLRAAVTDLTLQTASGRPATRDAR
jgi:hypothetical protein